MKKVLSLLLVLALTFSLASCVKTEIPGEEPSADPTEEAADPTEAPEVSIDDLEIADGIVINFAMGNNSRTLTYQQADPLTLADGTVVSQGDLKPTWQYIESEMGFSVEDITVQDQKGSEMIDLESASSFANATIFGGSSIAEDLMNYGAQGYFVNLMDYIDYMPDVKAYLEANPDVKNSITAYDGGVYHLPYVAEIDNYARGFELRGDWVTSLLDSEDALEAETATITVAYEGYWDRNSTNVIDLQNAAAAGGELTQEIALTVLKDYIAATYPELANPSDLYLGATAVYDMDELVALWRVIELSPNTLSKVSTGSVVEDAEISAFFVRKSKYREDVLRLITYFDGEHVHTGDSYGSRFYLDEDGNMAYSYADEDFLEKLNYIQQMYSEGLISSEFSDLSYTDEFRKSMFFADDVEGQRQFGFMTFDWFMSTTAGSEKIDVVLPPVTTISGAGINDFIHYVENTRAIKPDGWSISAQASEEEINAALKLFNYFFTEEGHTLQNYSIPSATDETEVFVGPDGTEYPVFSDWTVAAAEEHKNGDISAFLRDYMGSLLSVGFQKEIGFELQLTSENGFAGWDLYTQADVLTMSYGAEDAYLKMMPPIFSLNDQEIAKRDTTSVGDDQTDEIFLFITGADTAAASTDEIAEIYEAAGIETYLQGYQSAYARMTE